jgi:hypothetical protein
MRTIIATVVALGLLGASLTAAAGPLLPTNGTQTVDGPGL